jgi:hypothetical protein
MRTGFVVDLAAGIATWLEILANQVSDQTEGESAQGSFDHSSGDGSQQAPIGTRSSIKPDGAGRAAVAARANAVGTAGDRAVRFAITAMLWIRLEVIGGKTGPLAAALDDLAVHRRGKEITDAIAYAAVVWVIR